MRGDQQLTTGLIKQIRIRVSIREVWILVLWFFMFISAVSPKVLLVLEPGARLGLGKEGWDCL